MQPVLRTSFLVFLTAAQLADVAGLRFSVASMDPSMDSSVDDRSTSLISALQTSVGFNLSTIKGPVWYPEDPQAGPAFFLHYPHRCGGECEAAGNKWEQEQAVRAQQLREKATGVPPNVAFVFPNSKPNSSYPTVQQFYDKLGVPYHVYGQSWHPWDWWGKVTPLKRLILDGTISEPYVLYTDAGDVALNTTDFSGLVKAFKSYEASVVLGGRPGCYPSWIPTEACEFGNRVYPWSKREGVQAGTFMATREALVKYFEEMETVKQAVSAFNHTFDDQVAWSILHMKHYPDIKVDTQTKLFYRKASINE